MDNMTFGKYIQGNSIIHRLDPRLKICSVFIFFISVFFDAGFNKLSIASVNSKGFVVEVINVVVMNDGQVEKAGKVKDIFLDSDYLLNLGIDLPLITNLIIQLNLKGYHIDTSINDIDALVEVIGGELHG